MPADVSRCNLVDIGAIGSAKTALQATAGPFSQNRLLLGHTSSSSVRNHCRGEVGLTPPDEDCGHQESLPAGSIGLCGGSYCRRASSGRGRLAAADYKSSTTKYYKFGWTKKNEVRLEDESVWLTQAQMAELFQTSKQNVSLHTNNIFKEKELSPSEARNSASGQTRC